MLNDADLTPSPSGSDEWPITRFLPADWREMARETGAMKRRMRNLSGPDSLLRVLLIHLAGGCSLKESVKRASLAEIATISHVALHKRLKAAGEWFRRMALALCDEMHLDRASSDRRLVAVDASAISEPGATGTDWLVHYSLDIGRLSCDQYILTDQKEGERLTRFAIRPGDIYVCDRAYATVKSIRHVTENQADIIVRIRCNSPSLWDLDQQRIDLKETFKEMKPGDIACWSAAIGSHRESWVQGRLVCIARTKESTRAAIRRIELNARRKGQNVSQQSLDLAQYFFLWTSIPESEVDNEKILNWYRLRWQVELAFKRMKSIMGLGHLPKTGEETAQAWVQGKLFIGLLLERIHDEAQSLSPWGFPVGESPK